MPASHRNWLLGFAEDGKGILTPYVLRLLASASLKGSQSKEQLFHSLRLSVSAPSMVMADVSQVSPVAATWIPVYRVLQWMIVSRWAGIMVLCVGTFVWQEASLP